MAATATAAGLSHRRAGTGAISRPDAPKPPAINTTAQGAVLPDKARTPKAAEGTDGGGSATAPGGNPAERPLINEVYVQTLFLHRWKIRCAHRRSGFLRVARLPC